MSPSINKCCDRSVCRTASITPGLLITHIYINPPLRIQFKTKGKYCKIATVVVVSSYISFCFLIYFFLLLLLEIKLRQSMRFSQDFRFWNLSQFEF